MTASEPQRQRIQVIAGFAAFGLFWGTWGAVLPVVQMASAVSDGELGIALLMIGLGALTSMRLTGSLLDHSGRIVVAGTLAIFGVIGYLPVFAHGLIVLSVCTFALGAASGAADVCINALAVDYEAGQRKILNTGHATFSICVVLSSLGIAGLRSEGLPLWALLLCSQSVVVLLALAVMPAREPWHGRAAATAAAPTRSGLGKLARVPRGLVVLGVLGAIAYLLENAWQSWSAILLQDQQGAGPGLSSMAPAVFAAMAATGRLLGDTVAKRAPARQLLAAGAAIAAAGSVLAAHAPNVAFAIAGIAISGLGTSVCAPTILGSAGSAITRLGRAAAVSTVTTLSYLGFLLGPPLVGLIAARSSLATALTTVGGLAAVLAIASLTVPGIPTARGAAQAAATS